MRRVLLVVTLVSLVVVVLGTWSVATRTTKVVGARRDLVAGDRVTLGDVMPLELDGRLTCEGCLRLEQAATLVGATLVRDVPAGTPVRARDVTEAAQGPRSRSEPPQRRRPLRLPATARRGMRARPGAPAGFC
ncbi:MAG: SAF domain-containing protein [Myxococcaceae bacterium]|nr:SAF domain-containing protein [Myxococcaceae bacterium]